MKLFILILVAVFGTLVNAAEEPVYEIPVSKSDFLVPNTSMFHSEARVKRVTCMGKDFGVLYDNSWHFGETGSKFSGVCPWSMRTDYRACQTHSDEETRKCTNNVIKFYKLEDKYELLDPTAPPTPAPGPVEEPIPNMDEPGAAAGQ